MPRVGNSLNNHDIEFWFSTFKTELIYRLDIKRILFVQLRQVIADYIYYYNNVRIQKNWTGWHQFNIKINYNKKHEIWIFVQISCPNLYFWLLKMFLFRCRLKAFFFSKSTLQKPFKQLCFNSRETVDLSLLNSHGISLIEFLRH